MRLFDHLDAYATDDPDFNEGHPEDRCPLCEKPIVDHPCWKHRLTALLCLIAGRGFGFLKDTSD